ncbi:MAG: hypothetical protein HY791_18535 [Deltaproteobacteria bacterium]|nr:hypothetical protein [Deltaproteobacteria bacterium]
MSSWLAAILLGTLTLVAYAPKALAKGSELASLVDRAEKLLEKLELEHARELLEAATRDPKLEAEPTRTRARLFAVLGRARAELGDLAGMEEAFASAVRLDPKVTIKKSASPKIRDALERVRKASAKSDPKPKKTEKRSEERTRPKVDSAKVSTATVALAPAGVSLRLEGVPVERAKVRIVAILEAVPPRAEVIARVRIAPTTRFIDRRMIRTGTIATSDLELGPEEHAVIVEVRVDGKSIARAGSETEPFLIPVKKLPSIGAAHAEATPSARPETAPTAEPAPPSESPELWLFIAAGATLVIAATVATLVLAGSSSTDCEAERGFGCAEIRVVP